MKKLLLMLTALLTLLTVLSLSGSADTTPQTDTDGSVTGNAGAVYYNVASWSDMFEAYEDSYQSIVYLNVTADVSGDFSAYTGTEIQEGKSLVILGNHHTLTFAATVDPTTSVKITDGGDKRSGFWSESSFVTSATTLRMENVQWINSITYGIFEVSKEAAATTQYHNVTEMNGAARDGATPIVNRKGRIEFSGKNFFNITGTPGKNFGSGKQDPASLGTASPSTEYGQNSWIHGANDVNVLDGSTTVNINAKQSNIFYHYLSSSFASTLSVANKASLIWNVDNARYVDRGSVDSRMWNIGDKANFIVNGNRNTGDTDLFQSRGNDLGITVGQGAKVDLTTAGGLNIGSFGSRFINVADNGSFLINKLSTSTPVIDGMLRNGLNLGNDAHFLARGGSKIFSGYGSTIYLNGFNLNGRFSKNADGSDSLTTDAATGSIGTSFTSFSFDVSPAYSRAVQCLLLGSPRYMEFGSGPAVVSLVKGQLNRAYTLTANDLPKSYGLSNLISGQNGMAFTVNSTKANPEASVQIAMTKNKQDGVVSYFWKGNDGTVSTVSDKPITIWSMAAGYQFNQDSTGYNYTANHDNDHGLLLKTTNALKSGTNYEGATFDYTLAVGAD